MYKPYTDKNLIYFEYDLRPVDVFKYVLEIEIWIWHLENDW